VPATAAIATKRYEKAAAESGDAKTAAPIKADLLLLSINEPQFQVELKAVPLDGEPRGKSSRFVGKHAGAALLPWAVRARGFIFRRPGSLRGGSGRILNRF
jgi:hypothetical protein